MVLSEFFSRGPRIFVFKGITEAWREEQVERTEDWIEGEIEGWRGLEELKGRRRREGEEEEEEERGGRRSLRMGEVEAVRERLNIILRHSILTWVIEFTCL